MNHFTRLIDLTSADEEYVTSLANVLSPCILRPRNETSLTMEEKHAYRLIRDLFQYKDPIFAELKRMSAGGGGGGGGGGSVNRPRAISTDESNRRANMEERNRALLANAQANSATSGETASGGGGARTRAISPAPSPRTGHRRDRSVGGPETRFPIQTSPTSGGDRHRTSLGSVMSGGTPGSSGSSGPGNRQSLEVPEPGSDSPKETQRGRTAQRSSMPSSSTSNTNGTGAAAAAAAPGESSVLSKVEALQGSPMEKRNSLGRTGARFAGGRRVTASAGSGPGATDSPDAPRGVTLEDKPMDD